MKLNNNFANYILNGLIIIDIVLISLSIFSPLLWNVLFAMLWVDFFVCIFILIDWANELYQSKPKFRFLKKPSTWGSLIASISSFLTKLLLKNDIDTISLENLKD